MSRTGQTLCGAVAATLALAACTTITDSYDRWFGRSAPAEKPAELTPFQEKARARILWQTSAGAAENNVLFPAVYGGSVYAASFAGQLARFDAASGRQVWRTDAQRRLSGGVGAGDQLVLVGTPKGEVLAFDANGKELWKTQLSGEVLAPPEAADGIVVARTGDGRVYGLDARDGKRRWVYQRITPALTLRTHVGVMIYRGAVFAGFPGGRLVALALANGNVGWEAVVALPRGATELERVADVTSLPVTDGRQVCAVAFQGRAACFDILKGSGNWTREMSSVAGMTLDTRYVYVTDDKNAVVALDKANGASIWKQDKLAGRRVSAPLAFRSYVVVGDLQGYVHVLSREDGSFAARIATDGSPITAAPVALDDGFVVQTRNGGLYAITVQ